MCEKWQFAVLEWLSRQSTTLRLRTWTQLAVTNWQVSALVPVVSLCEPTKTVELAAMEMNCFTASPFVFSGTTSNKVIKCWFIVFSSFFGARIPKGSSPKGLVGLCKRDFMGIIWRSGELIEERLKRGRLRYFQSCLMRCFVPENYKRHWDIFAFEEFFRQEKVSEWVRNDSIFSLFCPFFLLDLFTKIIIYLVIEQEDGRMNKNEKASLRRCKRRRRRVREMKLTIPLCAFF